MPAENVLTAPGPTAVQVSLSGSPCQLVVLAKRTYSVKANGTLAVAPQQVPLVREAVFHAENPNLILADSDLFPVKAKADVVISGHAYGNARKSFDAVVSISDKPVKRIRVIGDRLCAAAGDGDIFFTPPQSVEIVELSYARAYGGAAALPTDNWTADAHAKFKLMAEALEKPPEELLRYEYPRNPAGCGFLLAPTPEAVAALKLPNLEDPLDLLTPERLAVREPFRWTAMPLPQATGWVSGDWFPRIAYLGTPPLAPPPKLPLAEAARGFAPANLLDPNHRPLDPAAYAQGASLGLQLPLKGDETITLENMHPLNAKWSITLPAKPPKLWTDGRQGKLKEVAPVLHTVHIEPDLNRVTLVWRGAAPALRPYLPQELAKMPLKVEWGE